MKILLFGGTTEGRLLAEALACRGHEVTVCVATDLGAEELRPIDGIRIRTGRMDEAGIRAMLPSFDLCVDATHPYAQVISRTLRATCREAGIPLRRILRGEGNRADGECGADGRKEESSSVIRAEAANAEDAAEFLAGTEGNILLATGAKELPAFAKLPAERLFARVLPTQAGIAACEAAGLPHRNVIAMQGPFSRELNEAVMRQYGIRWLVTKDGGREGGFEEKLAAAASCGAQVILIARPAEEPDAEAVTAAEFLEELDR